MIKYEELLATYLNEPPNMPQLCELLGVSGQTLRTRCAEFLGMTPTRYMLLRRLRSVRSALRDADPNTVNVIEVAHRFGFAELEHFAGTCRAALGEPPSVRRLVGHPPRRTSLIAVVELLAVYPL